MRLMYTYFIIIFIYNSMSSFFDHTKVTNPYHYISGRYVRYRDSKWLRLRSHGPWLWGCESQGYTETSGRLPMA